MLTIGLPFYNNESTLADTLRSVFAQSFQDWELLLVDDGSLDNSLSVAQSVKDDRVRVISDDRNLGLASRLNQIADIANGQFLARLDADDLMHPNRLEEQMSLLASQPQLDLVDTGLLSINTESKPCGKRCCHGFEATGPSLIFGQTPVHASVVGKTEWFRENRYDVQWRRAQDYELWNRAHANGTLHLKRIPKPYYFAREAGPTTYRRAKSTYQAVRRILRSHGPPVVGWPRTAVEIGKSHMKQVAYRMASSVQLEGKLVARRNQPLSNAEYQKFFATIESILSTPVPGLIDSAGNLKQVA